MSECRIAERRGTERPTHSIASDSEVYRYLLPRMGASHWDAREVRPMRDESRVSAPVRLTARGRVVVVVGWIVTAWTLALALPFWWTRL